MPSCERCEGDGWYNDHDPSCEGDERYCMNTCPVQVQCPVCRATGIAPEPCPDCAGGLVWNPTVQGNVEDCHRCEGAGVLYA